MWRKRVGARAQPKCRRSSPQTTSSGSVESWSQRRWVALSRLVSSRPRTRDETSTHGVEGLQLMRKTASQRWVSSFSTQNCTAHPLQNGPQRQTSVRCADARVQLQGCWQFVYRSTESIFLTEVRSGNLTVCELYIFEDIYELLTPLYIHTTCFFLCGFYTLSKGVQPFGVPGPHRKKQRCLGPHIKYTVACYHKKNLPMF